MPSSNGRTTVIESIREDAYTNVADNENLTLVEDHGRFESAHELRVGDRLVAAEIMVRSLMRFIVVRLLVVLSSSASTLTCF